MLPTQDTTHRDEARAWFTDQFRGKPHLQGIMDSLSASIQTLENVYWAILNLRVLNGSTAGDQLDQIGKIVGETRQGRGDAAYSAAVALRIRVNRSQGTAEDVLQVTKLALGAAPFSYIEPYFNAVYSATASAAFYVTAFNISNALALGTAIKKSRAAGTRGKLVYSTWATALNFVFNSRAGGAGLAKGFSSRAGGAGAAGVLVAAMES